MGQSIWVTKKKSNSAFFFPIPTSDKTHTVLWHTFNNYIQPRCIKGIFKRKSPNQWSLTFTKSEYNFFLDLVFLDLLEHNFHATGQNHAGRQISRIMGCRKSYTREFKLDVVWHYHNWNLYRTMKHFGLNTKTILRWVRQEKELILSRNKTKKVKGTRKATWEKLEDKLAKEIEAQRLKGLRVKKWWVISRAKALKREMDPSHPLSFSSGWFKRFVKRRQTTNDKRLPLPKSHLKIKQKNCKSPRQMAK